MMTKLMAYILHGPNYEEHLSGNELREIALNEHGCRVDDEEEDKEDEE